MNHAPIPNESVPIWELVIADMKARDNFGRNKYGTPLQMGNGRDHAKDAYEEVLDMAVYMKQTIIEIERLRTRLSALEAAVDEVIRIADSGGGKLPHVIWAAIDRLRAARGTETATGGNYTGEKYGR